MLDAELHNQGWQREALTDVLVAPADEVIASLALEPEVDLVADSSPSTGWLDAWTGIEQRADASETARHVLARIRAATGYVIADVEGVRAGVGLIVCQRGWAGVFAWRPIRSCAAAASRAPSCTQLRKWRYVETAIAFTSRSNTTTCPPKRFTPAPASSAPTATTTGLRRRRSHSRAKRKCLHHRAFDPVSVALDEARVEAARDEQLVDVVEVAALQALNDAAQLLGSGLFERVREAVALCLVAVAAEDGPAGDVLDESSSARSSLSVRERPSGPVYSMRGGVASVRDNAGRSSVCLQVARASATAFRPPGWSSPPIRLKSRSAE
jgi:hypothetical protein